MIIFIMNEPADYLLKSSVDCLLCKDESETFLVLFDQTYGVFRLL